ncbi:hypothetical protein TSOC_008566 [Tetrabaena socialis]|uniref:Uncharacterized protein n=1 Tax=Tetrabaena socialis TaxID=47790 RepID=A0A2J7ZY69_9CHLO|nr:hypothetical protein TSOC_008566 [Tetrabaena socialis]|eukprot:PNH05210.1 hypothetical protein TSOC_008566 [Tetrabaena socialis]
MIFLPPLVPRHEEVVLKEGSEDAQITALERELEAKNAAIRDWQRTHPVVGKPDAPPDTREGNDEDVDINEGYVNEGSVDVDEDVDVEEEL